MNPKGVGEYGFNRPYPSLVSRAQSMVAMLVFFLLVFALLAGPIWLPFLVDSFVGK